MIPRFLVWLVLGACALARAAEPKPAEARPEPKAAPGGRDLSYNAVATGPRTPQEERRSFRLPPGFEIELVAAESEGIGKFITVTWDARMRLWSMTALEYPVDGNEHKAASDALFARGGRDKVVVFDAPYGAPAPGAAAVTSPPRVFADGLVMPLGLLPFGDGAFVQYGTDIRLYHDANTDGRAERFDTILTGFGTQDSHLFPHQFTRQPGGTIFVAQGLFNYSKVRRPDGRPFADGSLEVPFVQCKLGRFTPDGSQFESLTAGPNNIWGLVTSREGETFIQEANDIGYPVIPYEPGIWVATVSKDRLRPYQPLMPPLLAPAQMGGTGLSGLALAEDGDHLFRRFGAADDQTGSKVFYLANPITNTINAVRATPAGPRYRYEKLPDFITTDDKWFRPVALHFGPDGALYIVDWYNKIISHNEVPRDHPDRDKSRGRIWRVRHRDQPRSVPPDLTRLDDRELVAQLGGQNALVSRLAWLELIDRKAVGVAPELNRLAGDRSVALERRLAALWALEGLQPVPTDLLTSLVSDPSPSIRHEVARLAAAQARPEAEFLALATPLAADAQPSVRAAIGDSLRRVRGASEHVMLLAARLGGGSLADGDEFDRYDREFERYLARWAMELNPAATAALLASPAGRALPLENRVLATLALGGKEAAIGLARLTPELKRPLGEEEVRTLAAHFGEPAVSEALTRALAQAATRGPVLRSLLALRTGLDTAPLAAALTEAARALLTSTDAAETTLGAQVAGAFRLGAVEAELTTVLTRGGSSEPLSPAALAALRALRENGGGPVAFFEALVRETADPVVRDLALAGLAAKGTAEASTCLVQLLPGLATSQRGNALDRLAGHAAGAAAIVAGLRSGAVARADVGVSTAEKLRTLLPADPAVAVLWQELGGDAQRVLRLPGGAADFPDTQISLSGPFTVEAWLKLDPEINWRDGLLGASGQLDLNFLDGHFRVWLAEASDIVVATKSATPGAWTHYAVTRDRDGYFRIYLNGELDAASTGTSLTPLLNLNLGRSRANPVTANGTTAGWLAEFRIWNVARSAKEIRENFDRSFAGVPATSRPAGLTNLFAGASWGPLNGAARVETADDAPALLTEAEATAQAEKFARFRELANARGNAERGQTLFSTICLACHQQGGKGGQIAPALDGVGNTGVEAILRNVLTPSAAMESAYRTYRVVLKNGNVNEGFLADEDAASVVLRTPGAEDRRLAKSEIKSAGYLRRSLMPDGLLEGMPPGSVSDLFAYLKGLK